MKIDLVKLKDTITSTIRKEDLELYQLHNKGIFFLPELAVTYLVGKAILFNSERIFGCKVKEWISENRVRPDLGPTDLVLKLENNTTVIFEFKTRRHTKNFINDINKLAGIESSNYVKFFCALIDCYAGEEFNGNKTIEVIEKEVGTKITRVVEQNKFFDYFTTKDHAVQYSHKQMSCVIGLWQVK